MARVFVSYSSKDRGFVEQLVRDLQANGVQPWYDQWEMSPGDSLTQKIGNAILENDYFVVILSPNSIGSEWVQRELGAALIQEFRERSVRVIPVLLQDCQVPAFLSDKVYADFRVNYRDGLTQLLSAVGSHRPSKSVGTSIPEAPTALLVWDNVVGENVTTENIK